MERSSVKIVIGSADKEKRLRITSMLGGAGFTVQDANTREVGILRLLKSAPDVLLLERFSAEGDDLLPRLAAMRLELMVNNTVVLLLTDVSPSQRDQDLAAEVSSLSFLSEPFEMGHLVNTVERMLWPEEAVAAPRYDVKGHRATSPAPARYEKGLIEQERSLGRDKRLQRSLTLREPSPPPRLFREDVFESKTPIPGPRFPQGAKQTKKKDESKDRPSSRTPNEPIYLPPAPSSIAEGEQPTDGMRLMVDYQQDESDDRTNSHDSEMEGLFDDLFEEE